MYMNFTLTVGTTAARLLGLLKGTETFAGASVSKAYPGAILPNGCQRITFQAHPDNGGRIFIGDGDVSSTNCGLLLEGAQVQFKECGHGFNDIPLGFFVRGSAASQVVNIQIEYA